MSRRAGIVVTSDAIVAYNAKGRETHRVMLASVTPTQAAEEAAPEDGAETYLSWCDDGITLLCEREECVVDHPARTQKVWYQEILPFRLTPEMAAAAVNAHKMRHTSGAH